MPDKVKVLYDAVSKDYNVGTYEEFSSKLADPTKRKAFYDGVGKEYALGEFKDFESKVVPVSSEKPVSGEPTSVINGSNILEAAGKIDKGTVSIQPADLRIQQEKQAAAQKQSQAKRLKEANRVFEVAQGKGAIEQVRAAADLADRTTVKTLTPVNSPSYLNIPGRVGAEVLSAASKLGSTVASIAREANYIKDTGMVGAPSLYDEHGEKTPYAKAIGYSDDFLGKMVLGANGLTEDANIVKRETTLPNTFMGRGLTSITGMAPDLIAVAATGGSSGLLETAGGEIAADAAAKTFGAFAKQMALNPFAKVMGARGFSEAYNAAEQKGGDVSQRAVEGGKEALHGFREGAMMELYGFGAGEFGKSASNFLKETGIVKSPGAWTNAMTNTAGNILVFGGQPLLAGDKTGAESGAFIGALFGFLHGKSEIGEQRRLDRQIKSINPELSLKNAPDIILDLTHANRINNLYKATPEAVRTAYESKMSADDMNAQSLEYGKRALEEGDKAKKQQLMVVSDTFRKSADIKRSVENIVDFKQDWHDYIDGSDRMTPEQKATFKSKVDDIAVEYNPIEKHKKSLADVIEPLEARKQELKSAVDNETDPVRKAERQAELDANNELLSAHQAELDDVTKRQTTGHVKVDENGSIVKLKNDEDVQKENEQTDKEVERFTEAENKWTEKEVQKLEDYFSKEAEKQSEGEGARNKSESQKLKDASLKRDLEVLKSQKKTGFKFDPIDNVPPLVTRVFEWLDHKIPAIDPAALKEASDWVYGKYKELSAMKKSDSRLLTIDQINSLQEQLGKDIDLLENHRNKYHDGENTTQLQEPSTTGANGKNSADQEGSKAGEGSEPQTTKEGSTRSLEDVVKDQKGLTLKYHEVLKERGLYDQAKEGKAHKKAIAAAKREAERRYGKRVSDLKSERAEIEGSVTPDQPTVTPEAPKPDVVTDGVTEGVKTEELAPQTDTNVGQSTEPPVDESKPTEIESPDGDMIPIVHADMESIREELDLEPVDKTGTTAAAIVDEAVKAIKRGFNVGNLIKRLQGDVYLPTAKEQAIMGLYIEALNKKNNEAPSSDLINSISEATEALFKARSRIGLGLGVASNLKKPKNDLTNHLILEQKAMGVKKLKKTDIDKATEEFNRAEEARKKMEEAYARAEAQTPSSDPKFKEQVIKEVTEVISKMKNSVTAKKDPASRSKKPVTDEDFASQRAKIKADMLADLKKSLSKTYASVPLVPQLIAIAPHVLKLVKSYVEQGVVKLDDIVRKLDDDIDFTANGLSNDDIHDIILGKYNKKAKSRTQIAQDMAAVRTEARLLKQLAKLQNAPEPKAPLKSQIHNDRIEDLRLKVKEARKKNKEDFPDEYDKQSIERRTKQLKERAVELEGYLKNGGFAPDKTPPRKVQLDAEGQKAKDEYIAFLKESHRRRDKFKFENQTSYQKYMHYGAQALGLRRLAQTSIDWSMPFRQVIIPTLNPRHWGIGSDVFKAGGLGRLPGNISNSMNTQAWSAMVKNTFSQKRYDSMMYDMEVSEPYKRMVSDKITFNSMDALENKYRNEDFRTSFIYKIPDAAKKLPKALQVITYPAVALVKVLEASQRAADSFINVARYELYLRGEDNLIKSGIDRTTDPDSYKAMAKWVMNTTGRGNFLEFMEAPQAQSILGNTFYGARLMASRFNMLNPVYYAKMPKEVRYEALRDITGYVATFSIMAAAAQAAGFTVSLNPDEADFLKFRIGDKRFDMTGGVGQYVRTGFRMLHATYNLMSPAVSDYKTEKYNAFAFKSVTSFFDYKLAPNASYLVNALRGKDALGNKFDPKSFFEIYPMYFDDIHKGFQSGDAIGTAAIVGASIIGVGAQTYSNKDERKTPDMKLATISDRGAVYDMEQNGLTEERKKYYNQFFEANKSRVEKSIKQAAKRQASMVAKDKASGMSEEQLMNRYKEYYMTDKDITNKVSDLAVSYSKAQILRKHRKMRIAD